MSDNTYRSILEYEPLFGSWHITRRLGSGAAGFVYEIEREDEFGVTLKSAMKVISIPAGGEDELKTVRFGGMSDEEIRTYYDTVVKRVKDELELMTRLRGNSHIVSYEDHEIVAHTDRIGWDILIRMELLTPLLDCYADHNMTEEEIIRMGIDLCKGLESCRQYEIVHRDIKPANIFINDAGDFKLGDFGIARIVEETQTSVSRKGTYTYMAPEVYRGENYKQTADIYSLGMVMYQCLNYGRNMFVPAFPEKIGIEDQENAFAKRMAGREVPLPENGSNPLRAIVLKACAFDRQARYKDATEMRSDLEALQRGEIDKISAIGQDHGEEAPVIPKGESDTGRRVKAGTIAIIIGLIIAAGCGAFALMFPWSIESVTAMVDDDALKDGTTIYLGDEITPDYVISPEYYNDEPLTFTSSDESVISVNDEGDLTAEGLGDATLTIFAEDHTDDDYSTSIDFKVVPKVTSIMLINEGGETIDSELSCTAGDIEDLTVLLKPKEFSHETVSAITSDESVADVALIEDDKIRITAYKAGSAVLTVSSGGCIMEKPITVSDPVIVYSRNSSSKKANSSKTGKKKSSEGTFGDYDYFD